VLNITKEEGMKLDKALELMNSLFLRGTEIELTI